MLNRSPFPEPWAVLVAVVGTILPNLAARKAAAGRDWSSLSRFQIFRHGVSLVCMERVVGYGNRVSGHLHFVAQADLTGLEKAQ
jgi:hypothetical protein